jgi:hypothetical protein
MKALIVKLKQGVEEGVFGFYFYSFYILVNPYVKAH